MTSHKLLAWERAKGEDSLRKESVVHGLPRASTEVHDRVISGAPLIVKGRGHGTTRLLDNGEPRGFMPPPTDIWVSRKVAKTHTLQVFR